MLNTLIAASRRAPLLTRALLRLLLPLLIGRWFVQHAVKRNLPANMITLVRGVSAPATVMRDAHGVPRIEAQTDADAFLRLVMCMPRIACGSWKCSATSSREA